MMCEPLHTTQLPPSTDVAPSLQRSQSSSLMFAPPSVRKMFFMLTGSTFASAVVVTVFFPCILFGSSYCLTRDKPSGVGTAPFLTATWDTSASSRELSYAEIKKIANELDQRDTQQWEQPMLVRFARANKPSSIRDYEIDYPQIYTTIQTTTNRKPPNYQRFPYRGTVDAKCEEKDEGRSFPDTAWCKRYFHCQNGFLDIYICPEVMVFNPKTNGCDHKVNLQCSMTYLNRNIANWRGVMTDFYRSSQRPWVRDQILRDVVPMSEVTTSTQPPIITFPSERSLTLSTPEGQVKYSNKRWYESLWNKSLSGGLNM